VSGRICLACAAGLQRLKRTVFLMVHLVWKYQLL
jgi:hypothetical protein